MAAPDFLGADIQRKSKCMLEEVGKRIMRQNLWENKAKIFLDNSYYIYACSAEDGSFTASFTHMEMTECQWKAHDGQQPDVE